MLVCRMKNVSTKLLQKLKSIQKSEILVFWSSPNSFKGHTIILYYVI